MNGKLTALVPFLFSDFPPTVYWSALMGFVSSGVLAVLGYVQGQSIIVDAAFMGAFGSMIVGILGCITSWRTQSMRQAKMELEAKQAERDRDDRHRDFEGRLNLQVEMKRQMEAELAATKATLAQLQRQVDQNEAKIAKNVEKIAEVKREGM